MDNFPFAPPIPLRERDAMSDAAALERKDPLARFRAEFSSPAPASSP